MKKLYLCCVLLICCNALRAQEKHVVLISIDGLLPEFYMDPAWGMVNIRQGMAKGAYAQSVRGSFPTVTYPSHYNSNGRTAC